MMAMRKMQQLVLATMVAVAVTACGNDTGPEDLAKAKFEAKLTGAVQATVSGAAAFGSTTDANQAPAFGFALGSADQKYAVVLVRSGAARPAAGTYSIEPADSPEAQGAFGGIVAITSTTGDELYEVRSGTVKVSTSSADEFSGTVSLRARRISTTTSPDIFVEATFRAVPGTIESPTAAAAR